MVTKPGFGVQHETSCQQCKKHNRQTGQEAKGQTETQEHQETLFQVRLPTEVVSILGDIQTLSRHSPGQPSLGDLA